MKQRAIFFSEVGLEKARQCVRAAGEIAAAAAKRFAAAFVFALENLVF
jgi:hypothetical protein